MYIRNRSDSSHPIIRLIECMPLAKEAVNLDVLQISIASTEEMQSRTGETMIKIGKA